jgi:hypothetical protein
MGESLSKQFSWIINKAREERKLLLTENGHQIGYRELN